MRERDHLIEGRFRIAAILAVGGMGETYLAWDDVKSCPVVVKYPRQAQGDDDSFAARFEREIEACRALSHRHVVPLIASGVDGGSPYLVMPLLSGGSLADRVSRGQDGRTGPSNPSALHDWLPAIAAALDHAHNLEILHRDVKPANIFFDARGVSYLGDFGIAKNLDDDNLTDASLTRTNVAMGTHYYMAPERYKVRSEPSGRADQYSLAACVYEALAGRRPFLGETDHVAVEHAVKPPPPLPQFRGVDPPETLRRAVERALSKDPTDRFETCTAFAHAALLDVPENDRDEGLSEMLCPSCRRVIRLRAEIAGRRGVCSRCQAPLVIGPICDWLWRIDAVPVRSSPSIGTVVKASAVPSGPRSWRRWTAATRGGVAGLAVLGMLLLWNSLPLAPSPSVEDPEPHLAAPEEHPPGVAAEEERLDAPLLAPTHEHASQTASDVAEGTRASESPASPAGDESETAPEVDVVTDAHADDHDQQVDATPEDPPTPAPPAEAALPGDSPSPEVFPTRAIREFHWVLVDDPGNAPDTNGLGTVGRPYLVSRYEITNDEYCAFLNLTEAGRRNRHGVADGPDRPADLSSPTECDRGIIRSVDADGRCSYTVAPYMGDKPVVNLRWCDAARLANWLHNGATDGADTETGAYQLTGDMGDESAALSPAPDARVWIPSVDEWYKAAFAKYKGGKCLGYWKYPTGSDAKPRAAAADDYGVGEAVGSAPSNFANITKRSRWPKEPLRQIKKTMWQNAGAVTSVGTNGKPSDYGTYDMAGNVAELVTRVGTHPTAVASLVGGDFTMQGREDDYLSSAAATTGRQGRGGVRLACIADPTIPLKPARASATHGRVAKALDGALKPLKYLSATPPNKVLAADVGLLVKNMRALDRSNLPADVVKLHERTQELLEAVERNALQRDAKLNALRGAGRFLENLFPGFGGLPQIEALDLRNIKEQFADEYEQHRATGEQLRDAANAMRITPPE